MHEQIGEPVNWELSAAVLTTATEISIRDAGGNARTLAADERLTITQLSATFANATPGLTVLFTDANGNAAVNDNERLAVLLPTTQILQVNMPCMHAVGAVGRTPKVLASGLGQVTMAGAGYITKG